jgi:hypothetical protein
MKNREKTQSKKKKYNQEGAIKQTNTQVQNL